MKLWQGLYTCVSDTAGPHFQRTIHLANDAVLNNSEGGPGGPNRNQQMANSWGYFDVQTHSTAADTKWEEHLFFPWVHTLAGQPEHVVTRNCCGEEFQTIWQLAVCKMLLEPVNRPWCLDAVQRPLRQDVLTATKTCKRLDAGVQAFMDGLKRKQAVRRKCQEIWWAACRVRPQGDHSTVLFWFCDLCNPLRDGDGVFSSMSFHWGDASGPSWLRILRCGTSLTPSAALRPQDVGWRLWML